MPGDKDPCTPVPTRKRFRANRADVGKGTPENIQKKRKPTKTAENQARKEKLRSIKESLEALQFDHNKFQIAHYKAKQEPPAGHWHDFCMNFQQTQVSRCAVCNDLLKKLWANTKSGSEVADSVVPTSSGDSQSCAPVRRNHRRNRSHRSHRMMFRQMRQPRSFPRARSHRKDRWT